MIRLREVDLPDAALRQLKRWQDALAAVSDYDERVAVGQQQFKQRNKRNNRTFAAVRRTLNAMAFGASCCWYCENPGANQIEHLWPKGLYPQFVFVWKNYLYICSPCNTTKLDQFAIFLNRDTARMERFQPRGTRGTLGKLQSS